MPELPEVETVRRTIAPHVLGQRIRGAEFHSRLVMRADPDETATRLRGRVIRKIERWGKFLLFDLGGESLLIHLGMTGRLLWQGQPGPHTRAEFIFARGRLLFDDPRQFGRIEVPARQLRLGPDALTVTEEEFTSRLCARRARVKTLLLDQKLVSGVGNIYADEALFRARIHPRALASRLSRERAGRLWRAMREILAAAVESGGSSISDYVDGDGNAGFFQFQHQVYQRTGEPCTVCGTKIRRIEMAQRGTHYCPKCQRV